MVADESKDKSFTIENNIYKGVVIPYSGIYKSVGEMVWDCMQNNKDKIAQLDARTEETVTYAELQEKIVKCALWLQKQGIQVHDVISVCTHNHVNSIVPCLAAAYINAVFNPWDEEMNLQVALHVLQLTMPKVIFCNEKSAEIILKAIEEVNCSPIMVVFGNFPDMIPFADILSSSNDLEVANFRCVEIDDMKDVLCILHSSGTTGMPKGVELSNYTILLLTEKASIEMTNAILLWFSSLYWISGVMLSLKSMRDGAKVIIYPEFDEEMTCKLIEKYKVTWLFIGTSMTNRLLKAGYIKGYSLPSLRLILCGGAILKARVQEELRQILPHVHVLQGYGMTELGGMITCQLPHHKNGSCGVITENAEMKVVDPISGANLGPNQPGELWTKSAITMNGYYKNPAATKDTIDEDGWLHTGDLTYIDEDGELFIVDRLKELIKYRGHQISPGEIETVLLSHPAVLEAGVVAVPHETDDEHPVAFITKKPDAKITEQELIEFVANNMMDQYQLRAGVIFLDAFPYTGSGKIAKKELKAMARELAQ